MSLAERLLRYRARNKISQSKLGELIGESLNMIHRCEKGQKLHKVNQIRIEEKMEKLEEKENV